MKIHANTVHSHACVVPYIQNIVMYLHMLMSYIYVHVRICMYIHMYNMYNIKLCMSMCIHDAVSTWRWLFLIIIVYKEFAGLLVNGQGDR